MSDTNHLEKNVLPADLNLKKLTVEQVHQIDEAISSVGNYGEVHIIVQRGRMRYINRVVSDKAFTNDEND